MYHSGDAGRAARVPRWANSRGDRAHPIRWAGLWTEWGDIEAGLYAKHKLATDAGVAEELAALAERGQAAKQRLMLIEANLRLVAVVAKRYLGRGMDLPGLIQKGNLG